MNEIRLLAPTGNLGSGYLVSSLERGLATDPHIICVDAGSTDSGPAALGTGRPQFARLMYMRDVSHILQAGRARKIPIMIGSAATSGSDPGVNLLAGVVREIAAQQGLHFRMACIYSEQPKPYVLQKLAAGQVRALWPSTDLTPDTVERAVRIVGMMGCEPLQAALDAGADVIVAGRASDTALFAALPVLRGFPPGPAWHAGKILECGASATVHRIVPDCMVGIVRPDHFIIWPPNPDMRCTPLSVAAHTLYENSDPFSLREPSGSIVTTECRYEQVDDRAVKVSGSQFEAAHPYTIKLEAAELVGYSATVITGIRDPFVLDGLDRFLAEVRTHTETRVADALGLGPAQYLLHFRVYGRDGVMGGLEPVKGLAHEVGLVFESVAADQEQANAIVSTARYVAQHNPIPQWNGTVTNLAIPHSPSTIPRGPAFRFTMNHVIEPDTPTQMFRTTLEEV